MLWKRNTREFQYMLRRWKQRHSIEGRGAAKYRVENGGSLFSNGAYGDVASLGLAFQRTDASMNRKETSFFLPQHPLYKESLKP